MLEFSGRRLKLRVIFMGTPEFAVPCLEHLIINQYQVVAVYTQPDKPVGRGRSLASPPVKRAALTWRLPVVQPVSLRGAEVVEQLASFHPDIIVVAAFGQILPQSVLDIPKYGSINIHPSLLPRFRGASPVAAAILAGDDFTGISIMLMDAGLDTGPILSKAQISISALDTTGSLTAKLSQVAARVLQEVLPCWLRGELSPQPQNEAEATYSSPITKEEGEIDWHLPAIDIWRRVRAFHPWPGCYTRWRGRQLKIIEAVPLPQESPLDAGQVVGLTPVRGGTKAAFGVGTGDGMLGVLEVQLEGKRAISAAEFLRGQRQFIGAILPLN
ncbi:MAG: methionyl-tRNA formyltransferase [Dehalococcoidia bacterium]|nr:MAG: methionyl-tRNA formyltransferase [Dehalococcoidia bacterium]